MEYKVGWFLFVAAACLKALLRTGERLLYLFMEAMKENSPLPLARVLYLSLLLQRGTLAFKSLLLLLFHFVEEIINS